MIRIPKVQRTGDLTADTEADSRRAAFSFLVKTLWQNPALVSPAQAWLVTKMNEKAPHTDPGRFENVTSFGKLDTKWLGGWLQHRLAWPSDVFQRAIDYDEDSLKQLIQFLLVVNPQAKLPKCCMEKAVVERLFADRLHKCGNREKLLTNYKACVASDGRLKWEVALFRFKWAENGEATHAVHLPTKAEVDLFSQARLTKDFEMRAHRGDYCGMVVKGATRLLLNELWPEGAGPNAERSGAVGLQVVEGVGVVGFSHRRRHPARAKQCYSHGQ